MNMISFYEVALNKTMLGWHNAINGWAKSEYMLDEAIGQTRELLELNEELIQQIKCLSKPAHMSGKKAKKRNKLLNKEGDQRGAGRSNCRQRAVA